MAHLRDSFSIFLRSIDPADVELRLADDELPDYERRRIVAITLDVNLFIRPSDEDVAMTVDGLRKLAAVALTAAESLEAAAAAAAEDAELEAADLHGELSL